MVPRGRGALLTASLVGLGMGGSWPRAIPGKLCTQNLTPLTFQRPGALKTLITEEVTQLVQAGGDWSHSKMKEAWPEGGAESGLAGHK